MATFPDVPQARTVAPDEESALERAHDALCVALAMLMDRDRDVPAPGEQAPGQLSVPVSTMVAAKLAVYQAMREQDLSRRALGAMLGLDEKQIRRLLDLEHHSRWNQLELALRALGRGLIVEVRRVRPVVPSPAMRAGGRRRISAPKAAGT